MLPSVRSKSCYITSTIQSNTRLRIRNLRRKRYIQITAERPHAPIGVLQPFSITCAANSTLCSLVSTLSILSWISESMTFSVEHKLFLNSNGCLTKLPLSQAATCADKCYRSWNTWVSSYPRLWSEPDEKASERFEFVGIKSKEDLRVKTLDLLDKSPSKRNPENYGGELVVEETSVSVLQETINQYNSSKSFVLQPKYTQQNHSMKKATHVVSMQNTSQF